MSSEELKPCPFCGGHKVQAKHDDGIFWHKCADCGATGPTLSRYSGEEGEPYTEWNTRAQLAALETENARLVRESKNDAIAYRAVLERQDELRAERDAALAQLAAIQQAKGDKIDTPWPDFNLDGEPYYGEDTVNKLVAQHQRITAAMAAELETWKGVTKEAHEYHSAAMIELARILGGDVSDEPRLKWVCGIAIDVVSERDALRAELAAVKGQEAVAYVTGYYGGRCVVEPVNRAAVLPSSMKLYALPPASPDVEGLCRLLAQAQGMVNGATDQWHNEVRDALSAWRQGQGKP